MTSWAVALALALTALVYDPRALAAEPKRLVGLVFAAVALSLRVARRGPAGGLGRGPALGLAFIGLSGLSLAWGLPAGARELGTLFVGLAAAVVARELGELRAQEVARVCALAIGASVSVITLWFAAGGAAPMRLHAGQGNPNWLGLLLALTLPLSLDALGGAWQRARRLRWVFACASALQLPALYLSHSRVAWLALAGAALCWASLRLRARGARRSLYALLASVALLALFFAASARSEQDVRADLALSGRAWIWQQSARAAIAAAPFGAGLGRFGHAYLDAQGTALSALPIGEAARRFLNATTAHNDFLHAAVESGPVAALLLALALLLGAREHAARGWLAGAATLVSGFISALGDSPLQQPAAVMLLGFVMGVPVAPPPAERLARRWPFLALLFATAYLSYDSSRAWLGTRARTLALELDAAGRAGRLSRSVRLDPASGEARLELGLLRLELGDPRAARDELERADALFADTGTRIAIGAAELALGRPSLAAPAFERALRWNAGSFRARLGLAEAYFREARFEEAEREARLAKRLMPGDPRCRELIDRIHEAQMDR